MSRPELTHTVQVAYLPEQSQAPQGPFAFAYTVTIRNTGDIAAQLVARHWVITDALGGSQDVRGLAVVGHQPLLKPGEAFEYTSWVTIPTSQGTMHGTFFCMTEDAHAFESAIPTFVLAQAQSLH